VSRRKLYKIVLNNHYSDSPWVFTLSEGKRLKAPRDSVSKGRKLAGLERVRGLHDLRHFRATQWLIHGVDIYTVKNYLGHKRIETTQRYLHLVPGHAEHVVRAAQNAEREEIEQLVRNTSGRHLGDTTWADEESHVGESVLTH